MTTTVKTYNWIEYNTYGNTPLVYVTFCLLLEASTLATFMMFREATKKKKEIRDPEVNSSYSTLSITIVAWTQFDLISTLI